MSIKKTLSFILFSFFSFTLLSAAPVRFQDVKPREDLPKDRPSVCVVLSGGGAKGFAQLPYMEYIDQLDIPIDMVIGCSIGAIVGGFYSAGYSVQEIIDAFSDIDWTPYFTDSEVSPFENVYGVHSKNENLLDVDFDSSLSLHLGSAVSNGQLAYQLFRKMLIKYPSNKSFDDLPVPFRATATDMITGDAIALQDGDLAEAIRASMSLPGVFNPIEIDGHYLMDGGLRFNLPINLAKAMGYDIVIAIDISAQLEENPEAFSSNPVVGIMNASSIAEKAATDEFIDQADLVMFPDYKNFGALDFNHSRELYEAGKSNLDEYKDALEEIRKRIYPDDYDDNGKRKSPYKAPLEKGVYNDKTGFIPTDLIVEGAVERDLEYIQTAFQKVNNGEFSPKNYDTFLNDVYLTGNYTSIRTRLMDEGDKQYVKLITQQRLEKEVKVLVNPELKMTMADTSSTTSNLELEVQARGYSGIGSMFSFRATLLTDYGAELFYMQPFGPNLFMDLSVGMLSNFYRTVTYGTLSDPSGIHEFNSDYLNLNFGVRTPNSNLAKIGLFARTFFSPTTSYREDPFISSMESYKNEPNPKIFGFYYGGAFQTEFGTMKDKAFADKGWCLNPAMKHVFMIDDYQIVPCLLISQVEFKSMHPVTKKFSIGTSLKAGVNLYTEELKYYGIVPYEAFSTYDRVYFPSITSKDHFGTNIGAGRLVLQFKPKDNLTILGGQANIRLESTAGFVNYNLKDTISIFKDPDTPYPIIWSQTVGLGIKGNKNVNTLIRFGACSTHEEKFNFLFCVDMGNIRF